MADIKLEDLPTLTLVDTTLLFGEKSPYTTLADAGKFLMSALDSRFDGFYVLKAGDVMSGDLDMGNQGITSVGHLLFDLAHVGTTGVGHLHWNNTDGTLEVGLIGGTVVLQIGQEVNAFVVQKTGLTIPNGKAVIVTGVSGERLEVSLTDLSNPLRSAASGLTTESIDNNQQGYMTTFGLVRELDTSMWAEGAFIWADGSSPGELTNVRPDPPLRGVFIGFVVRSHPTEGSIWVFPFNIPRLQFLSDVSAPVLADRDVLRWVSANSRWETFASLPIITSATVTTQGLGVNPDIFAFGFYEFSTTDANLTQASTTQVFGTANISYAAHAFAVAGGVGSVDTGVIGLRVNGTSITDAGVRTPADTETLSSDITTLSLNDYVETSKKWLGQITYELFTISGSPVTFSLDFNYGLAKYDDISNNDFTIASVEAVGFAGSNDSAFDIQLFHHRSANWVYAATGFIPSSSSNIIASLAGDHSTDDQLINGGHFAWKRTNLSQVVDGNDGEGFLILISSSTNNAVEYCNLHVGVLV